MEENKEVLLTQEGYDKLEKELEYLRTEKRAERGRATGCNGSGFYSV